MKFVVIADEAQWKLLHSTNDSVEWIRATNIESFLLEKNVDAYFNLLDNACDQNYATLNKPVFINSVIKTLAQIQKNEKTIRFNGWQGFVEKPMWEITGIANDEIATLLKALGKTFIAVEDIVGFVSARVIAMIINEAYFALEDEVSTKAEIDIAMKLGTNYPYGPFEWAEKIGLENVYKLLETMAMEDDKYTPAVVMKNEINK
jgi:3-hydroxybutyryl-CoA dehydrogenase